MWPRQMPRIPVAGDQSWRSKANCLGVDPSLFFPPKGQSAALRVAKTVCRGCSVREECLTYALDNNVDGGVWGATSERERKKLRRQREAERGAA